ncbi:sensor histidine kinase, partial [Streptomyces sp. URMC 125]|uniref:sensor histidine kinase n=1 Tax=Streptomyces sp. URMC 125 TaxID=3423419 RepID=UPI003F1D5152
MRARSDLAADGAAARPTGRSTARSAGRAALAWAVIGLPVVFGDRYGRTEPVEWWWTAGGLAGLAAAVALVRTRPVVSWQLAAGLSLAAAPGLFSLSYGGAQAFFAYVLGRRAERTRPALRAFAAVAAVGTALTPLRAPDPVMVWLVLVGTLLFGTVFPWLVGRHRRQDGALMRALVERAEHLERERTMVADRARLRERTRIAEDMHDALGHELSLIALRAGALQVAPGLAEEHRSAAGEVRAAAAAATDRLREIIGVLRDPDPAGGVPPAPLGPTGETVAALVERAAGSGMAVRLAGGAAGLPAPVERAAHRVVQEALTNAAKHAPGTAVTVAVEGGPQEARVTVVNGPPPRTGGRFPDDRFPDGCVPAPGAEPRAVDVVGRPGSGGGGSGLAALRERVRLVGGEFTAGPLPGGGFRVSARLPYAGAARMAGDGPPVHGPRAELDIASLRFSQQQRAGRRWVLTASAVAGGAAVAVVAAVLGWYAYTTAHSVLPRETYERLRIGDREAEVGLRLPDRSVTDPPTDRAPAPPTGARCAYYRTSGELFTSVATYRLCFADGRLVEKTVVPMAGSPVSVDGGGRAG